VKKWLGNVFRRLLQGCLGCLAAAGLALMLAVAAWLCTQAAQPVQFAVAPLPAGPLRLGHLRRPSERLLTVLPRLSGVTFEAVPLRRPSQAWQELSAGRLDLVWVPVEDFAAGWARYGVGKLIYCPVEGREMLGPGEGLAAWPQDQGGPGLLRVPSARVARNRAQAERWLKSGQASRAVLCPPAAGQEQTVLEVWVASDRALRERRSELQQLVDDFGELSSHWGEQRAIVERAAGGRGSLQGLAPADVSADELRGRLKGAPVDLLAGAVPETGDGSRETGEPSPEDSPSPEGSPTPDELAIVTQPSPAASPSPVSRLSSPVSSDLPLRLPGPATADAALPGNLAGLLRTAEASNTAYDWRVVADAAVAARRYSLASRAYGREAELYKLLGDPNAAQVEAQKAARYGTQLVLYAEVPQAVTGPGRERLEPQRGCYVGAFIDRDDSLEQHMLQSQIHGDIEQFNERMGKRHASFFMYRSYGTPFPSEWVEYVKSQGAIPHIAWEPPNLDVVKNDQYLKDFVEAARQADWPLFIRFAGEMNGDWTPYHGNPARYRQAFRTVYEAFRRAPRAALIWCPNTIPQTGLDDYYPGDDACDWVGVNFYSVLYLDNDRNRPGDSIHPGDLLDYVYRKYSGRKPIAIGEYAATHQSSLEPKIRADFAVTKLNQLYGSLPTRYPRVKLVSWYDCNNLKHARPGRQLNNYVLTDQPEIVESYREAIRSPWFLTKAGTSSPVELRELKGKAQLRPGQSVQAWFRTYLDRPQVYFRLDGKVVHATRLPGRSLWTVPAGLRGAHQLEVLLYDERGQFIEARKTAFVVP